ncbi:hypothetical protein ABR737_43510 [Streptomyces sp. Edi2]|uniref:hypothetical protein n=1 Tax=Streptomyces sp. Edi2 TaxID=3162528 RepID=UPI003306627A
MIMFNGTAEEFDELQKQARELAEQAAAMLDRIDALGVGSGTGQIATLGGVIRRVHGTGWVVFDSRSRPRPLR